MSTLKVNTVVDASGGNTATVNGVTPNADTVKGRNLIINGAMQVAQRGTSASGVGAVGDAYLTIDRFAVSASTDGRLTMSQNSVTDLPGFTNSLKLACTTADTSVGASDYLLLSHRLEGQNLQQLKKGTSSAESVTVSFYVKGNANATYVLELYDNDNSRSYSQLVPVTSSWNRVSLTYSGDTTGALDNDNAISLQLVFWLHAGSTYSSGTLNTSWTGPITQANRAVGISSILDSTARTLEITGLKMEVGSVATEFDHRSFDEEWNACQRYCTVYNVGGGNVHSNNFIGNNAPVPGSGGHIDVGNRCEWFLSYPVKRTQPTITVTNPTHMRWLGPNNAVRDGTGAVTYPVGTSIQRANIFQGVAADFPTSVSPSYWGHANSGTYPKITIDSEL